jgi:hypothetical protein
MGSAKALAYLASPAVVAASAMAGYIVSPPDFARDSKTGDPPKPALWHARVRLHSCRLTHSRTHARTHTHTHTRALMSAHTRPPAHARHCRVRCGVSVRAVAAAVGKICTRHVPPAAPVVRSSDELPPVRVGAARWVGGQSASAAWPVVCCALCSTHRRMAEMGRWISCHANEVRPCLAGRGVQLVAGFPSKVVGEIVLCDSDNINTDGAAHNPPCPSPAPTPAKRGLCARGSIGEGCGAQGYTLASTRTRTT